MAVQLNKDALKTRIESRDARSAATASTRRAEGLAGIEASIDATMPGLVEKFDAAVAALTTFGNSMDAGKDREVEALEKYHDAVTNEVNANRAKHEGVRNLYCGITPEQYQQEREQNKQVSEAMIAAQAGLGSLIQDAYDELHRLPKAPAVSRNG